MRKLSLRSLLLIRQINSGIENSINFATLRKVTTGIMIFTIPSFLCTKKHLQRVGWDNHATQ
jgi:hypothetical protein